MSDTSGGQPLLPTIAELQEARTDCEDVAVEALGGKVLRLYGLGGTNRAVLMSKYAAFIPDDENATPQQPNDPEQVKQLLLFQVMLVSASLGYREDQWAAVGDALGSAAVEQLFDVASRLSGLGPDATKQAVQRLRPVGSGGSGTD